MLCGLALASYEIPVASPFGPVCPVGYKALLQLSDVVSALVVIQEGAAQFVAPVVAALAVTPF